MGCCVLYLERFGSILAVRAGKDLSRGHTNHPLPHHSTLTDLLLYTGHWAKCWAYQRDEKAGVQLGRQKLDVKRCNTSELVLLSPQR